MHPPSTILHTDMDAFFASVAQASDPRLRGRPIAVGGDKRGVVASASYEARAFGVSAAMPVARARRLCPQLVVVQGDYERYEQFSRWMFSYARDLTPLVEVSSIDEGYLDLSGSQRDPREAARDMARIIEDKLRISVSEGLATNKLVSQVASKLHKPRGFVQVQPGHERAFLAKLPHRRLPGIGPKTGARLTAAGIATIGQIADTPLEHLRLLLGETAPTFHQYACGIDDRPVQTTRPEAKSYGTQRTFDVDQTDLTRVEAELRQMADDLLARVRHDGKMIRTVTVALTYNDMARDQAARSFAEPVDLEEDLYGWLRTLLRKAWRRRVSLRRVRLKLSRVYSARKQVELAFDQAAITYPQRRRLADTVDRLREQRGRYVVMRGHDLWLKQQRDQPTPSATASPTPSTPSALPTKRAAPPAPFVPLRMHSHYSLMDGTLSVDDLTRLATRKGDGKGDGKSDGDGHGQGLPAMALTDTANLHGAVSFTQACRKAGVKPILGAEFEIDGHALVLLVATEAGYRRLCRFIAWWHDGALAKELGLDTQALPPTPFEAADIWRHLGTNGLIAIAENPAWRDCFDTFHTFADVAMPNIRYADPAANRDWRVVKSIGDLTLLDHGASPDDHHHFPSASERAERFTPAQLAATVAIADQCTFELTLGELHLPTFRGSPDEPIPHFLEGAEEEEEEEVHFALLERLVTEGMANRYPEGGSTRRPHQRVCGQIDGWDTIPNEHVRTQIHEELEMIRAVGYAGYFLVVWELLQACRHEGINWITRGSAADSLVIYCLGISGVCPVRFDLYFKRFLNRERMAMNKLPDIDIDFAHDERDRVVEILFERYGTRHTAAVGGFSTFLARSALGEVAKVLGMADHEVRRVTKAIPRTRVENLAEALAARPECADLPLDEEPLATAVRLAEVLDGAPRYPKMHPCGIVVAPVPILDMVPTFRSAKGLPTTQFDMDAVEDIGLVKFDILAQGGLAVMRDVAAELAERGITIDLKGLSPWEDEAVWDLISSGQARGVHHIESPAMISLARMCNTRDIDTLVAQVSVIRPGAANESKKLKYTRRYQGMEAVTIPHPSLADCLRETYGLIVYEEQVMQVCEAFAGLDPGTSDQIRRALVKQKVHQLVELATPFAETARAFGRTEEEIKVVWAFVCGFLGYAFCKAHSVAYGIEAYESAWLKLNYPAEFMASVLTHGKGFYRPLTYTLECRRLGIGFLPPSVNGPPVFRVERDERTPTSEHSKTAKGRIRVPVTKVKGIGSQTSKRILTETACEPFANVRDFVRRIRPNRDEALVLLNVGAFDEFNGSRTALYWELAWALREEVEEAGTSVDFFDAARLSEAPMDVERIEPDRLERLRQEWDLIGFPASDHPLALYPEIPWGTYCQVAELGQFIGKQVVVCGLVVQQRTTHQLSGELMKFMTIADWTGMIETELFAKGYREHGLATVRYPVLEVTATVEAFENVQGHTLRIHRCGRPRGWKRTPGQDGVR